MYRARPDVGAVVHGHPSTRPPWRPRRRARVAQPRRRPLRRRPGAVRGHARLVTGPSGAGGCAGAGERPRRADAQPRRARGRQGSPWAAVPAATLERAARIQSIAATIGRRARADERRGAEPPAPEKYSDRLVDEYWAAWLRKVAAARRAPATDGIVRRSTARRSRPRPAADAAAPDFLRDELGLTGAKRSCDVQVCGTCTVLIDGRPVSPAARSPTRLAGPRAADDRGPRGDAGIRADQRAFTRHAALQCGFCTPGMALTVAALLRLGRLAGDEAIREALAGQSVPLHGYRAIIDAVRELAPVSVARLAVGDRRRAGATRSARKDCDEKMRGRARYVGDMSVPGMLHGKVLRSQSRPAGSARSTPRPPRRCPASVRPGGRRPGRPRPLLRPRDPRPPHHRHRRRALRRRAGRGGGRRDRGAVPRRRCAPSGRLRGPPEAATDLDAALAARRPARPRPSPPAGARSTAWATCPSATATSATATGSTGATSTPRSRRPT